MKLLEVAGARGAAPGRAPMALSKALRLLRRLEASGESSVLLEARGRRDCLLFEAGTVATLGECGWRCCRGLPGRRLRSGAGASGRFPRPLPRGGRCPKGRAPASSAETGAYGHLPSPSRAVTAARRRPRTGGRTRGVAGKGLFE